MDGISHLLWTYLLFRSQSASFGQLLPALFFGVLPDLCLAAVVLSTGFTGLKRNRLAWKNLSKQGNERQKEARFRFLRKSLVGYRVGHSALLALLVLLALSLAQGALFVPVLAWFLHIALDLFSHKGSPVEPQQPFWPAAFDVKGFFWWHEPWALALNWGLLALAFFFLH